MAHTFNCVKLLSDIIYSSSSVAHTLPGTAGTLATQEYVQTKVQGLDVKESVKVATTSNVAGTYNSTGGASARGQITATLDVSDTFIVDDVTLSAANNGARVLLKNQTAGAENGIYTVTISGTALTLDRATDFDADAKVTSGAYAYVSEGTVNATTQWILTTTDIIVLGGASGTVLTFSQFSGASQITAGDGLDKSGNTLSLDVKANSGLVIDATELSMNLSASSISGTLGVANGGTGNTTLTSGKLLVGAGTSAVTLTTFDAANVKERFVVNNQRIDAISSTYTTVAYFSWHQIQYSNLSAGKLTFSTVKTDRDLDIRLRNNANNANYLESIGLGTGTTTVALTSIPTEDDIVNLQVRYSGAGSTNPSLYGGTLEFSI